MSLNTGTGFLGDTVVSSNETLTRQIHNFRTLQIDSGATLTVPNHSHIACTDTLTLNGTIAVEKRRIDPANTLPSVGQAGGALTLAVDTLAGSGTITADGGNGGLDALSGSGQPIDLPLDSDSLSAATATGDPAESIQSTLDNLVEERLVTTIPTRRPVGYVVGASGASGDNSGGGGGGSLGGAGGVGGSGNDPGSNGGSGGGAGGFVSIATIQNNASSIVVTLRGGDGGDGSVETSVDVYGGGGGGGGGGFGVLTATTASGVSFTLGGGAGGTGTDAATDGDPGADGFVFEFDPDDLGFST